MSLYKYYQPESVGFILTKNGVSVRLSQPELLNDPFEGKPAHSHFFLERDVYEVLDNFISEDAAEVTDEELYLIKEIPKFYQKQKHTNWAVNNTFGISSFSKNEKSNPMWAYYSKDHTGFLIEFEDFNTMKPYFHHAGHGISVKYTANRYDQKEHKESWLKYIVNSMIRKDSAWTHEREFRVISHLEGAQYDQVDDMGFPIYSIEIPKKHIKRIILGYRSSKSLARKVMLWKFKTSPETLVEKATLNDEKFLLDYEPFYPHA
ncbi:DUF2971 domain-containing protein [Marinomonas ostreistagni]|uniref:DUF2971 domain-containing protein n=1 Tax=Marinomonas ostreistagni TaxID=359209 RepID=UPI001950F956|nr:DUF2971 domain-containing protein [Marinomonas ostreistagni]MBM6552198.1 DUF2971 domain-containing protein [Marinomonas ostreistagni]